MPQVTVTADTTRVGYLNRIQNTYSTWATYIAVLNDSQTQSTLSSIQMGDVDNWGVFAWSWWYLTVPTIPAGAMPKALLTNHWFYNTNSINSGQPWSISSIDYVTMQMFQSSSSAVRDGSTVRGQAQLGPIPYTNTAVSQISNGPWYGAFTLSPYVADLAVMQIAMNATQNMFVTEGQYVLQYANAPTSTVQQPTASQSITNTVTPLVAWAYTAGTDGGPQVAYRVMVYTQAQTIAGGFVAGTTPPTWDSGPVTSTANSTTVGPLANSTTYVVYVQVGQSVNGNTHWSASFATQTFSIAIPLASVPSTPTTPTVTVNSVSPGLTIQTTQTTTPYWDHVTFQRSTDGATWQTISDYDWTGGSPATAVDYTVPPFLPTYYRVRAQKTTVSSGLTQVTVSPWVQAATQYWTATTAWLVEPISAKYLSVRIAALDTLTRRLPKGSFDVPGRANPVIVSDTRKNWQGTIGFAIRSYTEYAAFRSLVNRSVPLVLHIPHTWIGSYIASNVGSAPPSATRWIVLGDEREDRPVALVPTSGYRTLTYDFTEVDGVVT